MPSNQVAMDLLDNDEINRAALSFKNGVVKSKNMVNSMPKKSVSRVYNAFIEFPLGDSYPKFRDKKEQALFNLTLELVAAKNVMMEHVIRYQEEVAAKLQEGKDGLARAEENGQAASVPETTSGTVTETETGNVDGSY